MENAFSAASTFAPLRSPTACRISRLRCITCSSTTKQGEGRALGSSLRKSLSSTSVVQAEVSQFGDLPGETVLVQSLHEGVRVELLDIPYARLAPGAIQDQLGAYHG